MAIRMICLFDIANANFDTAIFDILGDDETLHLADSLAKSGIKQLGEEVIAITDEVSRMIIKLMYETLHIVDWFWGKLRRKISDWTKQDKNTSDWTKIEKNDTNWQKK